MLELYLVRHGATQSNHTGHLQGHLDVPLNAAGAEEASATARFAARLCPVAALYASPLQRAHATALRLSETLHVPVQTDARWMEMDVGNLQGLTWDEARVRHPEAIAEWYRAPREVTFPGARESIGAFVERVGAALASVRARHPAGRVVVVSHGGALNVCLSTLLQVGLPDLFPFHLSNCGISHVHCRPNGEIRVQTINDTRHLDHDRPFSVP